MSTSFACDKNPTKNPLVPHSETLIKYFVDFVFKSFSEVPRERYWASWRWLCLDILRSRTASLQPVSDRNWRIPGRHTSLSIETSFPFYYGSSETLMLDTPVHYSQATVPKYQGHYSIFHVWDNNKNITLLSGWMLLLMRLDMLEIFLMLPSLPRVTVLGRNVGKSTNDRDDPRTNVS